jgi:hypothetical protein
MTVPVPAVSIEQAWPGRRPDLSAEVPRLRVAERLADRRALVLLAAAERGADEEHFGLGVWLLVHGPTYVAGGAIIPDGRPDVARRLAEWCSTHSLSLSMLSEFFDWRDGRFRHDIYTGRGWLLSADLGRTLGLCSEDWAESRGRKTQSGERRWEEGFTLWLPTWSSVTERPDGRVERRSVSPHLPALRIKAAGAHGLLRPVRRTSGRSSLWSTQRRCNCVRRPLS